MSHMRLLASSAIIVIVILITFALSVPHTRDAKVDSVLLPETELVPSVTIRDSFKKGVHTISGSVEAPNACASVSASSTIAGNASSTQSILVAISLDPDSGICLQVPARIHFQTTVSAPADLPISATVNGSSATTTSS